MKNAIYKQASYVKERRATLGSHPRIRACQACEFLQLAGFSTFVNIFSLYGFIRIWVYPAPSVQSPKAITVYKPKEGSPDVEFSHHAYAAIDLFAGCGGMSLGLENANFRIIHANELNQSAAATYQRNFPHVKMVVDDIRRINISRLKRGLDKVAVDIIAAGPPCQGFSVAGKRKLADPRNRLFIHVLKFVKAFHPKVVVIENVVGMLSMSKGRVVKEIMESLKSLGYHPHIRILLASAYGVPQERKRVFIIATSKPIPEEELFPAPTSERISVEQAISDLAFLGVNEEASAYQSLPTSAYQRSMREETTALYNHQSPKHSKRIQERFASIPHGRNGRDVLKNTSTSKHTYYKLHPKGLSRTLTTLPEDFIHYRMNRIPTVREMARLQSFPDHFEFLGPRTTGGPRRKKECPQYTQVGNAVPPLMAEAVFRNIARILSTYYPS